MSLSMTWQQFAKIVTRQYINMTLNKLITALKGGSGSGNFGHSGRPGKIGGSAGGAGNYAVGDVITGPRGKGIIVNTDPPGKDFIGKVQIQYTEGEFAGYYNWITPSGSKDTATPVKQPVEKQIDAYWQRVAGTASTSVMHGTSVEAAKQILKTGIDKSTENQYGLEDDRSPAVYITADKYQAIAYGEGKGMGGQYAIVHINVPKSAYGDVKVDELDLNEFGQEKNFRIEQRIPAEWVTRVDIMENDEVIKRIKR